MTNEKKFKVIIAQAMAEDGINLLRYLSNFDVLVLSKKDKEKLLEEIVDADALIVRSGVKVTEELLKNAKKLKIVGRAGAGYDNIDVDACSKAGIIVMVTPGGNTNGVVELTIGLLFSLVRHIPKADKTMKEGIWAKKQLEGTELKGKTIGLIGLGKIGGKVSVICHSLGMKVLALVRNKNKKRDFIFQGEFVDSLDDLLPNVDFISMHLPLNSKTKGLIGEKELNIMKPNAYIVNTSRGAIIDEEALYRILKEKKIAGAAIDVYSEEPTSKDKIKFIELENVISIPHLGASTKESQANVSRIICENTIEGLTSNIFIDAVNLPFSISIDNAPDYRPIITLARKLGQLAGQYLEKPFMEIKIIYRTENIKDIKPIAMNICTEALKYKYPGVNQINVEDFLNDEHISLILSQDKDLTYNNSLTLEMTSEDEFLLQVRGTIIAGIPKIIQIQKIDIDMIPSGRVLIIRNVNTPGVVGQIGSILGKHKINIAEMHLGRSVIGGETKGAVCVDNDVPAEVIQELKDLDNIVTVTMVVFD